ncbi:HAD family hydrolase [Streptomyces albidus (ex Kaewkla and Franco 2022)]|uniref:HAD family hydrolase n=1 Tax=Streptomyces albidus (ex Kaewkla and Franco 2022) TaxID=722709 RepID=UPI0015EF44FF|nr:HAD-IA family hydrolase [Streptomyces albidus (ex Kaewkla and Franco 2022)]
MTAKGVLFDFSGTLLRVEPTLRWLRAAMAETGIAVPAEESAALAHRLESAGAQPGGASPQSVPQELRLLWEQRDEDAAKHRAAFTGLARQVPLPHSDLYDALYERSRKPDAWQPYPDTAEVLSTLAQRGVPVAVVSNIGWDLRPVFREHGLAPYVRDYVLSYEHGVQKPDPRLFLAGCAALGLAPQDVLMVGDEERADSGAAEIGCAVHLVRHLPPGERPDGLRPVLALAG